MCPRWWDALMGKKEKPVPIHYPPKVQPADPIVVDPIDPTNVTTPIVTGSGHITPGYQVRASGLLVPSGTGQITVAGMQVTGFDTTPSATIYFSDDFSSGNIAKTQDGWLWNNPQGNFRVDVVSGFSKDGNTGKCARFTWPGGAGTPRQTQAQLAFTVGTPGVTTLWTEFYVYYPNGTETIGGIPQPAWVHPDGSTGANNNKFFALYKHYTNAEGDALRRVFETWQPYSGATTLVEGQLRGGWRNQCSTVFSHDPVNNPLYSFERADKRGIWRRVQIGHRMESAYLAADGHMEVWVGDNGAAPTKVMETSGYTEICNTGAGANQWNYGYLLGFANSSSPTTQYNYISHVRFSSGRLED